MNRVEEFVRDGKRIIYFDLSSLKTNDEFASIIEQAKRVVEKYTHGSIYTITNIKDVAYDSETKEMVSEWMRYNRPYVRHGAIIGVDGVKRIMINAILKLSGRSNMSIFITKDQAMDWIAERQ